MKRSFFVGGVAAFAADGAVLASVADGQGSTAAFRVDVHHHLLPPFYADAVKPQAVPAPLAHWTPQLSFADMDQAGTATAILSMPRTPSVYFGGVDASRALARRVNEYLAQLKRTYPARFGFWAETPLPDVQGAVQEAVYALDNLGADGITVATSYGHAWLGDPMFAPLWEELDRRKAIVFTHPLSNECCLSLQPGIGDATIEYGTDTTRTIASIVFSGSAERYPNVRFIFAHCGGTMPYLIDRFRFQARDPKLASAVPHGVDYELRRFYYDTAQAATPEDIGALSELVPTSHIMFGTDFPYRHSIEDVQGLAGCGLKPQTLQAISRQNALALLGR